MTIMMIAAGVLNAAAVLAAAVSAGGKRRPTPYRAAAGGVAVLLFALPYLVEHASGASLNDGSSAGLYAWVALIAIPVLALGFVLTRRLRRG
ncbi:hypothetical protein P3T37_001990 [Kitasatospora sp. MAA4]|uniref:hypothetical protein n=1 Tax=Kitasatospora sp. MAA4 TaxID=3035093 RepID=UPI0024732B12|nr:hypothetical protein [Kitasatospora sp. MAA4]MDH6132605.1 hypothetical protein [Kitasatospora sp. MAA4]